MRKIITLLLMVILCVCVASMTVNAATETYTDGYYTYTVTDDCATIKSVDSTISGYINVPDTLGGYPVIKIGTSAFSGCKLLEGVSIPTSVTAIGERAFSGCEALKSVSIPDGVKKIEISTFYDCSSLSNVKLSKNITEIKKWAFEYCESLTSIVLPDTLTKIGGYAFSGSGLVSITIPDSVVEVDGWAFSSCKNLKKAVLSKSLTSVEIGEFAYCNALADLTIPEGVTMLSKQMFDSCESLVSVVLPSTITDIDIYAFQKCKNLKDINVPYGITYLSAFWDCESLTSINVPSTVTSLGGFQKTAISSISIPKAVNSLGTWAFAYCKNLKSVSIPDGVEQIPYACFRGSNIVNVFIPNTVTYIGDYAFASCKELQNIYYVGTPAEWSNVELYGDCFSYANSKRAIHYLEIIVTKEPTCTEPGMKSYYCACCDYTLDFEVIPATNHANRTDVAEKKSTCKESGYTAGVYCNNCDKYISGHTTIPVISHEFGNWYTATEATCTVEGKEKRDCQYNCGTSETKTIAKVSHKDNNGDYKCDYGCGYEFEPDVPEEPIEPENPNKPQEKTTWEKIVDWFKNIIDKLFGWMKKK